MIAHSINVKNSEVLHSNSESKNIVSNKIIYPKLYNHYTK